MSAKDFFLTELPPIIAEIKQAMGDRIPKISYDVEFEIDGEGMYSVQVKNGEATVRRGGAASPIVAMRFAKHTWEEALTKIIRPRLKYLASLDPKKAESEAFQEMQRQLAGRKPVPPHKALEAIASLPLRVVLEITAAGGAGTPHEFECKLAGAEEDDPTVTVSIAERDMDDVLCAKLTAQEAFKTGKLKMKGSVTTAMALLSRLFVA
jgi:hypothetical protein